MPTYRTVVVDAVHNDEKLRLNLDLLKERCEHAAIREAKAKSKMRKYYNARVRGVTFRPGDFVYRSNDAIHAVDGGNLGPKWEGPYEVMDALGDGVYKLRSTNRTVLPRTWNITNLKKCLEKVKFLIVAKDYFTKWIEAKAVATISGSQVLVEILKEKSIREKEMATIVEEEGPTWMTPIIEYLRDETLPENQKEASKLRIKARQYELLEGILYRRSCLKPWLRCVGPLQADYVIREIHEGSCSMHAGPRSMVAKTMRSRYYWPTIHPDAREMIRKCKSCQIHRPVP
nr:reverse transcriptase domain-containing protein [Tanacetum cinerariifolium]